MCVNISRVASSQQTLGRSGFQVAMKLLYKGTTLLNHYVVATRLLSEHDENKAARLLNVV